MKNILIGITLLALSSIVKAVPVVYTVEADYLSELATLGYTSIHEGFENDTVWDASRNTTPPVTPTVTSQGIVWSSNFPANKIVTGSGAAAVGDWGIYSNPHGLIDVPKHVYDNICDVPDPLPPQCFQNDGLKVESATGDTLYGFGGRVDTTDNNGKFTFLLDGVDINDVVKENNNNWFIFVGVIDEAGFLSAEIRELSGKDGQQNHLFADDFTIASSAVVPLPAAAWLFASGFFALIGFARRR
jgi:hypothetical protein